MYELAEDEGMEIHDDVFSDVIKKYDKKENLVNFVAYELYFEEEQLAEMTAAARAEIEEEYSDIRDELFEQEEIYSIAANLQYYLVKKLVA